MADIDITKLVNKGMPKTWTCPHCGKRNRVGPYKEEELIEFEKTLQHCYYCGYVHLWKLELTEDFKHSVVDMLLSKTKKGENHD
ncbi:MAG: hypothetical protein LKG48_04710 [Lachnospiraceae bacterium]|jgi:transcription elongation factor Elf1|nr:hypothetical protein [Lachnospiraceae bacterium]MCH4104290.1 hypothetical protein [Lachnospiraceae bacterium]MCI1309048.1 hypothetical protein [Lachnospiraceae bacterium]MCI1357039.1 hypothetical protein [Lachnospiraceae bacterium]MCI1357107.1 hypothetical protein [Lachnospiraceae bacterium]